MSGLLLIIKAAGLDATIVCALITACVPLLAATLDRREAIHSALRRIDELERRVRELEMPRRIL